MWIEFCQIHGQDSRSSHSWTKTLPKEKRGQRCDSQGCKTDLIICGLKFGPACRKQLRKRRSGNGPLKSQSSMTRWEAFISLIRMIKSSKTITNARKSWRTRWKLLCPVSWRRRKAGTGIGELIANPTTSQTQSMHASSRPVNVRESDWKGLHQKITKITLRRRVSTRWVIPILRASSFPCTKRWKFQMQRQQWTKNGRNSKSRHHGKWPKWRTKKKRLPGSTKREKRTTASLQWLTSVISKNAELEPKYRKYKARVVFRGDTCSLHWTGLVCVSNDCDGQAADAVYAYTPVNLEELLKFQSQRVHVYGYVFPRHTWPKSWSNSKDPVVLLERNLYGHRFAGFLGGKIVRRSSTGTWMGKSLGLGMSVCSSRTRIMLVGIHGGWKKAEYGSHVEEIDEAGWCWRTNIIPWPRVFLGCTQRDCKSNEHIIWRIPKEQLLRAGKQKDRSKSHGFHIQTARVRRTSSWCNFCLYPGTIGRCSQTFENSKSVCPDIWIRLPRHKWPKSWSSMEDPVVPLERNLYGHHLTGLLWERQFEKILLKHGWEKVSNWECLFVHRQKGLFLSVYVDDIKLAGKKQNIDPMWKVLNKEVDLGEPTLFLDHVYLGCTQRLCEISKDTDDNYRAMFESRIAAGGTEKLPCSENLRISSWSYGMERHAKKCVERYCELANKTTRQLYKVSTLCIDDHHFKEEELESVGELSKVCSQIILKCLYFARIGRPGILWSVNKIARTVIKWTRACDKRLARLISYIHQTNDDRQ